MAKKKILWISDHPLSTSGVGCQARYLIEGLLKTERYTFRCLGAAIKHGSYDMVKVNDDWFIKPIDGFGDRNMIRMLLAQERPDALVLFTDPRFFGHIFHMEDEVHQLCPITWWHVWDNDPWPEYNNPVYDAVDLLNCHSHKTYTMCKENLEEGYPVNWIPHTIPESIFHPLDEAQVKEARKKILGDERKDWFVGFWVNRNARRKMPGDVIGAWKIFLDKLEDQYGHRDAVLVMHTDPMDQEGPNLFKITEHFQVVENVMFSTDRVDFAQMNVLHNIADFYINIACNEGFGLGTLESMMTGSPIIALKTGGMTKQVMREPGVYNGIGLDPEVRNLVGSQQVPYIYEDHISNETVANAILEMYEWGEEKRKEEGQKALAYAKQTFDYDQMVKDWDETLWDCINNWDKRKKRWVCKTL